MALPCLPGSIPCNFYGLPVSGPALLVRLLPLSCFSVYHLPLKPSNIVSLFSIIDTICFSPCPSRSGINPFLFPAALYSSPFLPTYRGASGFFRLESLPVKISPSLAPACLFLEIILSRLAFSDCLLFLSANRTYSEPFLLSPKFSKLPSSEPVFPISRGTPLKPAKIAKLDSN